MKLPNVGVIGCGVMGVRHLQALKSFPFVNVSSICDIDERRLQQLSVEYKVPKYYKNYNDMLSKENLDAVIIATPDGLHKDPAIAAIRLDKNILIEKPIATTLEDAEAIIKATRGRKGAVLAGHTLHFDHRYWGIKQMVSEGKIGNVVSVYSRRCNSIDQAERLEKFTDVIMYLGIHEADIVPWIVGSPITKVYAKASFIVRNKGDPDFVKVLFEHDNGALGVMELSWSYPSGQIVFQNSSLEVVGTAGMCSTSFPSTELIFFSNKQYSTIYHPFTRIYNKITGSLLNEELHFINCVAGNDKPVISLEDAYKALKVALAIKKSIKEKREINVNDAE